MDARKRAGVGAPAKSGWPGRAARLPRMSPSRANRRALAHPGYGHNAACPRCACTRVAVLFLFTMSNSAVSSFPRRFVAPEFVHDVDDARFVDNTSTQSEITFP